MEANQISFKDVPIYVCQVISIISIIIYKRKNVV